MDTNDDKPGRETIDFSEVTQELPMREVTDERGKQAPFDSPDRELVAFKAIYGGLPKVPAHPPTYEQWIGGRLAVWILSAIISTLALLLLLWWWNWPTIESVKSVLGETATPRDIIDTTQQLQRQHVEQFRDVFQLVVMSALVPLFTLTAGYAFGTQRRKQRARAPE